jgi:PAS domain S-box-containing protein
MVKKDLRILMLEDDRDDADLNLIQLELLEEYNCIVKWVSEKKTYLEALETFKPEIILSDYNLPNYNGLMALNDMQERKLYIPFIFVTGTLNEETAVGTIKSGAWDYVVKDRLFRLPLAIRGALQLWQERMHSLMAEEQNTRLSAALEQSPSHIVITDTSGKIEYVNARFVEITGYKASEVNGKTPSVLKSGHHTNDFYSNLWSSLKNGHIWHGEFLNKKKDGTLFWESASISPLKNKSGQITHYIAVKEDITHRKNLENELLLARDLAQRSNQLKTAFLQNMSHEIRTPLNAIVGFSSMLNDNELSNQDRAEYTNIILNSSNQLLAIVTDILTVSRLQTGQEEVNEQSVDLNKIISDMHLLFNQKAKEKKLLFVAQKSLQDKEDKVIIDDSKLCEILSNLLNNAFKFTPYGSVEFGYRVKNDFLEFYVKDTGIGIKPEMQEQIFERFAQADMMLDRKYGGTGLGLSISKSFVELLGGRMWLKSENNIGSTFYFTLPYKPVSGTVAKPKETKINTVSNGSKTVLVAEDEYYNFVLIREILKRSNITLLHAENGKEAIKFSQLHPEIDMILMDIKMPEMDGISAFKEIRRFRPNVPVIAQTAYALEDEKVQFMQDGFDDYISKPINKKELLDKLEKYQVISL